ncbi:hypothetical protein, partial [Streptomyces corynorhini]|uniref:hypothetical protein n=1 Tax=Streptomyces corynorhini TaxID=2282652 RepID=UPI001F251CB2
PLYSPTEHFLGLSSGRFPSVFLCFVSVLRFRLYQTLSCPIPRRSGVSLSRFHAFAFPFPAVPTLPDSFGVFCLKILMAFGLAFCLSTDPTLSETIRAD